MSSETHITRFDWSLRVPRASDVHRDSRHRFQYWLFRMSISNKADIMIITCKHVKSSNTWMQSLSGKPIHLRAQPTIQICIRTKVQTYLNKSDSQRWLPLLPLHSVRTVICHLMTATRSRPWSFQHDEASNYQRIARISHQRPTSFEFIFMPSTHRAEWCIHTLMWHCETPPTRAHTDAKYKTISRRDKLALWIWTNNVALPFAYWYTSIWHSYAS